MGCGEGGEDGMWGGKKREGGKDGYREEKMEYGEEKEGMDILK